MKKWWRAFCLTAILLMGTGLAYAQPEPVRHVEVIRKPGVDFRQFKSVGTDVAVSLAPTSSWAIDKRDSFLEQRIQELSLTAAKKQGWVPIDNVSADVKLSLKILEWGRLRTTQNENLAEFVTFELKVYAASAEGPVFRGTGQYSRMAPPEPGLEKMSEAYVSMLEELFAALHKNE
jgi:hypothetical protein